MRYRLKLSALTKVHDVFHVSILKKFNSKDIGITTQSFLIDLQFKDNLQSKEGSNDTVVESPTKHLKHQLEKLEGFIIF